MPKVYTNKDVLTAALERFEIIFNDFDNYYFSLSGGKDSSVMFQLAAKTARQMNKKISVLYIDFEAQYKATIDHIEKLIEENKDILENFYWVCLPMSLRNAVSVIQPKWICWDQDDKKKWVRDMPKNQYVINEKNMPKEWTWFEKGMEFEDFILYFAEWFNQKYGGLTAAGIGIRTNESFNRFRTIISDKKERYNGYGWTTRVKIRDRFLKVFNVYPL